MTVIATSNAQVVLDASSRDWILPDGNTIMSTNGQGIYVDEALEDNTITVEGDITANMNGIFSQAPGTTIIVGDTAIIKSAYSGIVASGSETAVTNRGVIIGGGLEGHGIFVGYGDSTVDNFATINGKFGITALGPAQITNEAGATINATLAGIWVSSNAGVATTTLNAGMLKGGSYSFHGGDGKETFINRGAAHGNVDMGAGNDTFDGRGGALQGSVTGWLGNDTYFIDSSDILLVEANKSGIDKVNSTVSYTLPANFENLTLIGTAAVNGAGNLLNNTLTGNKAANKLWGAAGNDTLDGGKGNDKLTGGAGHDVFVFETGYGRDRIGDFTNGHDHIDLSGFDAVTGFTDLRDHHLKVSGDDVIIFADADRLVIEDTKKGELDESDFIF